jgi:hypothetical protein
MNDQEAMRIINTIDRVKARPVRNGFQIVAIDLYDNEYIVKKSGALRGAAHFYYDKVNGNAQGQGLAAYVKCAKKPDSYYLGSLLKSINIEVAA